MLEALAGTCRWGEFGAGGLLWGECTTRHFEWFEGNPVTELLYKVHTSDDLSSVYTLIRDTFLQLYSLWICFIHLLGKGALWA